LFEKLFATAFIEVKSIKNRILNIITVSLPERIISNLTFRQVCSSMTGEHPIVNAGWFRQKARHNGGNTVTTN
jgi:hypothetical protein